MASKTARRDAGAGALYQDSRGLWTAAVTLPPGPDGKRRRKVVRARTKAAASDKLKKLRADLDRTGDLPTSSPTLEQWMRTWLKTKSREMKPNSLVAYSGPVDRYILPTLGRYRLDKLTAEHVRRLHAAMLDDRGLSPTTAANAHSILFEALKDAMREGRVTRNVAELVDRPRRAVSTRGALSADNARTLLAHAAPDPSSVHWFVALLAGLRQGERLGLTREAIDLERGVITVIWQLQRLRWAHGCLEPGTASPAKGAQWPCGKVRGGACPRRHVDIPAHHEAIQVEDGLWLTRPKTRAGWREVPMAPLLADVMRRHLESTDPGLGGLVLHRGDPVGRPIDPAADRLVWRDALAAAGLPPVSVHSARHTTATLLHAQGVSQRVRVAILGHASATTTAEYTHVTDAETVEGVQRLGALLSPRAGA
ncbi:tyrosine-type recombinase/integrase [Oerskovia sp. NPDC060287]|uniref:tyrosine-type recombinase/integrase n=1 Tax=Oerskovia sp. NPDC060287 TaxID=3347095 RepID=UPI0036671099